jgi:DNA-directed RNA polymerase subunit RPC12/RpoP
MSNLGTSKDMPHCPNCQREQKLVGENQHHWAFRCPYCVTTRIISKPTLQGASRLEAELKRREQRAQIQRHLDSRPTYSFPKET